MIRIAVVLLFVFSSACATSRVAQDEASVPVAGDAPSTGTVLVENLAPKVQAEEIIQLDRILEEKPEVAAEHTQGAIPIELNDNVQRWIDFFAVKDQARFRSFLERGMTYRPAIEKILEEHEVPKELYFLAMIESGFVTHAKSRAKAVGVWQFMSPTGKQYGLKRSHLVDERRDVMRATAAAARFLKDLNEEFGSWYLAMAAYNAGGGRIRRAIRKGGSRDFWVLVEKRVLPRETMQYVPKFLAAMIIGGNTEKYGFMNLKAEPLPELAMVKVPPAVRLRHVAQKAGLVEKELAHVNPQLVKGITPPGRSYSLWVPSDDVDAVRAITASLEPVSARELAPPPVKVRVKSRKVASKASGKRSKRWVRTTANRTRARQPRT